MNKNAFQSMFSFLPYVVALIAIALSAFLKAKGMTLGGPRIPMSWGLAKDILDMGVVLLFPWDGWVFLIPLCGALILRWRAVALVAFWLVVSLVMGLVVTEISFEQITILRCAKGTVFYMAVFCAVAIFPVVLSRIIEKRS